MKSVGSESERRAAERVIAGGTPTPSVRRGTTPTSPEGLTLPVHAEVGAGSAAADLARVGCIEVRNGSSSANPEPLLGAELVQCLYMQEAEALGEPPCPSVSGLRAEQHRLIRKGIDRPSENSFTCFGRVAMAPRFVS